jgi:hypothetical protein
MKTSVRVGGVSNWEHSEYKYGPLAIPRAQSVCLWKSRGYITSQQHSGSIFRTENGKMGPRSTEEGDETRGTACFYHQRIPIPTDFYPEDGSR